jgi:hypothetical protein
MFPKLKNTLEDINFRNLETIKCNGMERFLGIPKTEFEKCFQQEQEQWSKCVCAQEFFEGS